MVTQSIISCLCIQGFGARALHPQLLAHARQSKRKQQLHDSAAILTFPVFTDRPETREVEVTIVQLWSDAEFHLDLAPLIASSAAAGTCTGNSNCFQTYIFVMLTKSKMLFCCC